MKKLYGIMSVLFCVSLILSSCSNIDDMKISNDVKSQINKVMPQFIVTGDVENEISVNGFDEFTTEKITYNENQYDAIKVIDLLNNAIPKGNDISVFLCAPDNVMAQISLNQFDENDYIIFSENGWQFVSKKFPPQSGIKNINKIMVSAKEAEMQKCFRIIYGDKTITKTYGELFLTDSQTFAVLEGEAKKGEYKTNPYTRRSLIPLINLCDDFSIETSTKAIGYFNDGSQCDVDLNGYIEFRGNSVDYIGIDKKSRKADMIGLYIDPPISVTQVPSLTKEALKDGNVLIIELDGLGYYNLEKLNAPFLKSKEVKKMRTVMPSISNVSLAAIITGKTPNENGVTEKGIRKIIVDDMFNEFTDEGKTSTVVEGMSQLVTMSVEQKLNPDKNGDDSTDDDVMESAIKAVNSNSDVIYVHFHGFDDVAHTYGPFSNEAQKKLTELDENVKTLSSQFKGTVLVIADHGQHNVKLENKLGSHGEFLHIDMTTPFLMYKTE